MTHPDFSAKALTELLSSDGGAFAVVCFFVIFQYIFKQDFFCPCDPDENIWFCIAYILLPFTIFTLIIIVVDKIFLEICTAQNCTYSWVIVKRILRALTVGTLWIVTALMDGDWWVCYVTTSRNITARDEQPLCKDKPTSEQSAAIRHWKSISRVTGMALLCVILLIWAVFTIMCKGRKPYNKALYKELLFDETDHLLKKKLKHLVQEAAKEPVKDKWSQMLDDMGLQDSTPTACPDQRGMQDDVILPL
ncbi:uncharacterized protein LOC118801414 [Colossoma macropomum]|uniref:uncharacterized protein LOC118801414 n=1 Tax=Colossoma macropomum TaxID=42526 RepID=UPI001864BDD9|nr:uncharacterized protein LOC118801414 [Colossoma macropomum]